MGSSPFQETYLPMMAVVAIVGIGVLLMISIRSKIARRNADRPSPREMIEQLKAAGRQRGVSQSASAELLESARGLAAKLDNKAARLEVLIQQADERISLMSQLSGTGGVAHDGPSLTRAAEPDRARTPVAASAPRLSLDPLTRSVYELADTGFQPLQIAQELDEQVGKVELILSLRDR